MDAFKTSEHDHAFTSVEAGALIIDLLHNFGCQVHSSARELAIREGADSVELRHVRSIFADVVASLAKESEAILKAA